MLPKIHRLSGSYIPRILKAGRRYRGNRALLLVVSVSDSSPSQPFRATVIVPVRLSKKAVVRNRTKRLLVEALHRHIDAFPHNKLIILMAQTALIKEKLADITGEVDELLQQAGLLNK